MIRDGEVPSTIVYEDDKVLAFEDINPRAPVHVVVIPKKHLETFVDLVEDSDELMAAIMKACVQVAKLKGVWVDENARDGEQGFRVINNCGVKGGQVVWHVHMHVLGGKALCPSESL